MSEAIPFPHDVSPAESPVAMAEETDDDRRSWRDRRSAWSDPRLWVSVLALVLTIGITILSVIATQLSSINGKLEAQAISNNSAAKEIEFLKEKLRDRDSKDLLRDTYITNARERILALEAEQKLRLGAKEK